MIIIKDKDKLFFKFKDFCEHVLYFQRPLFLTTSTRWDRTSKSTQFAELILKAVDLPITEHLIDVTHLTIYDCEGNVSDQKKGNCCGAKESVLKDSKKNPSGYHRCWCSLNHDDDELWKITKRLFESDLVVFFGSVRWGQANGVYQRLIERLTWIENRHTSLRETNIVKDIAAGLVFFGHNWNVHNVLKIQKQVLKFFGFQVYEPLCLGWQWTENSLDETLSSYEQNAADFLKFKKNVVFQIKDNEFTFS